MIVLRPFTREEYHDFFRRYVSDPAMDPQPYRYSFEHVNRCFDYDESRRDWYPTFGIFADNASVGSLALKRIDKAAKKCEIGLVMADDTCKNRGYGTAAMQLGMKMAVEEYGVQHIWADTMSGNLRMQHVLDKLGFRLAERVPHVYDMPDGKQDRLIYVWEAEM